jgi:hypothetical protein
LPILKQSTKYISDKQQDFVYLETNRRVREPPARRRIADNIGLSEMEFPKLGKSNKEGKSSMKIKSEKTTLLLAFSRKEFFYKVLSYDSDVCIGLYYSTCILTSHSHLFIQKLASV